MTGALPLIIQGGMGVAVSGWRLANAVASAGQLGVVSGTMLDTVLVRRLQDGDLAGHVRRALARFPWPEVATEALERYFLDGGRAPGTPYRLLPLPRLPLSRWRQQLLVLANFVEVFLAREGHGGAVGINLLTKVQIPTLASLYGAMLAGVDYVLMGAGIPREIPGALDRLAEHEEASWKLVVDGPDPGPGEKLSFSPKEFWTTSPPKLRRPRFLPIISATSLAQVMVRRATGRVDGFVVEGPTAGGHNAPPRGAGTLNQRGEPVYGERDRADLEALRALDLPFWVAGGAGSPGALRAARAAGAAGVQVGTLFAFAEESGISPEHRRAVLDRAAAGELDVFTDPRVSPTGYPFKVVGLEGTLAEPEVYAGRNRRCDLGYLRSPYRMENGKLGYRCPAEPIKAYVEKGGAQEDTTGRKCLCNALLADVGMAQVRPTGPEPALLTAGDDLREIGRFLAGRTSYTAADVLDYLLRQP